MPPDEIAWQRQLEGLRRGDAAIVTEFCQQYGALLHELADKRLGRALRRRVGPEDVVQSVCRTFLRRAQGGQFQLNDSTGLWALLCAITLNKIRKLVRFHQSRKRSVDLEVAAETSAAGGLSGLGVAAPGPTPAEAAEFSDGLAQLLAGLDAEEQQLVDLKLQDYTNEEIAEQLGSSERTVRRILNRVKDRLAHQLEVATDAH